MEFILAVELKKKYTVYGHFYNLKLSNSLLKCRSTLEIRRKHTPKELPDIIVIMMNPGSSVPLDKSYGPRTFTKEEVFKFKTKEIIAARPDNAQYQIMRLMEINNWNFVRILNLSDLRNGNSGKFRNDFKNASKLDKTNPHCLTHFLRKEELTNSIKSKSNTIIAAWGDIAELRDSAESILKQNINIIGLKKGETPNFRYASPYLKTQKIEWLLEIQKELNKNNAYYL
ncbi:MAG: hypothetical protein HKO81_02340 [Flavobacteriaceae bacterium]|nr:hypothetical protein [Bacteroidia bacterium]NNL15465.1 hypothetical protein [Flavobacteriaceae bacterium]